MKASRLFGPVAVLALFVSFGLAQESNSGAIVGVVRDPTGAVVAGAAINARNTATNVVREAVSNGDGLYAISGLAPGEYELSARQARFATLTTKKEPATEANDPLRHIEVPLWISFVGVPILSIIGAAVTHQFFGVSWFLAVISLPLIFLLTVICTNSMALTSWTPVGALSKITQFTMGAIDRVNPATNLIPATMTAEIASNAANLLSDIKPGYMLGAKPRQQALPMCSVLR